MFGVTQYQLDKTGLKRDTITIEKTKWDCY